MGFIVPHLPLLDLIFIGTGYALSQAIVFRAGTFLLPHQALLHWAHIVLRFWW